MSNFLPRYFLIALIFSQTSLLFSKTITGGKTSKQNIKKLNVVRHEPVRIINNLDINHQYGPKPVYNQRDAEWTATLIDSSLNGYGPYTSNPNPLSFSSSSGYIAVYRQFQGLSSSAGYLGASQSEDGEEWFTEQRLNITYPSGEEEPNLPTATGTPQARYPSAGISIGGMPTAIWNEYTNSDHGGGTYGGYPLYAYDSQGGGEQTLWTNTFHVNNGCNTMPCDPSDLWNANASVISGQDGPVFTSLFNGWSTSPTDFYWINSNLHANGYFIMNDPYVVASDAQTVNGVDPLWLDNGNYTSDPDVHINQNGVGYIGQIGYSSNSGSENPKLHTFWFKKTEDFGNTWTSVGGYMNSGYGFISDETMIRITDSLYQHFTDNPNDYPDQLWYGDTITYTNVDGPCYLTPGLFPYYDFDMRTDNNGGLHLAIVAVPFVCSSDNLGCEDFDGDGLADTLYTEGRYGNAGHYYLYNPNPFEEPNNWRINLINDLSETYSADWAESDIFHINSDSNPPMYYFYPQITLSEDENSQVIWYAGFEGSGFSWSEDSLYKYPNDIDIYMSKSTNFGLTWSELENVTNTPGGLFPDKHLEVGVHLASSGTNDNVGVFYQVPDFYTETYPPATGYEDYLNRIYVGIYGNTFISETEDSNWELNISGQIGDLVDQNNILGMSNAATNGLDEQYDVPEPPSPPSDYFRLSFFNPQWDDVFQHYSSDIRQYRELYGNDVEIWDVVIESDSELTSANISLTPDSNFPISYTYWLINGNDTTDVTNQSDLSILLDNGNAYFSIMVKGAEPDVPLVSFTNQLTGSVLLANQTIDLNWDVQNEVTHFDLHYSMDSGESFSLIEQDIDSELRTFSWTIPDNLYSTEVIIRITANGLGNTEATSLLGPLAIIPSSITFDLNPGWNLFGLPFSNPSITTNVDNYYLFSFQTELGYNSLDIEDISSGVGYWAAIFNQTTLTAESTNDLDTIEISLSSGWNLINSSLPFDVDFELLSVVTTEDTLSFVDAVSNGYITSPSSFYWDGANYRVTDSLLTNKGSWISANSNISLLVPPEFHVQSTQRSTGRTVTRDENNWALPISIQNDQSSDFLTSLGVKVDANPGFDVAYDMPTPPSPPSGSILRGYFSHPDWNIITGSMFSTDYVSPIGEGSEHVWNLMIDGNVEGPIEVSWESINELLPDNYQAYLDHDGESIDMNETSYINLSASDLPIELDIIVQSLTLSLGHEQLPTKFGISQNYPNPFNPTTTLKYQLPEFSAVNISIYDMLGNLVKTLLNTSESPGYKSVQWNATNNQGEPVSAGVYLYKIQAGDFIDTKKMILLK